MQVVPLTSNVDRLYPSEAFVTVNGHLNKAMADQLTTVGKSRLINQVSKITRDDMLQVERAIKLQLALPDTPQED